jgi:transglutaminase-like putative cysteine protease
VGYDTYRTADRTIQLAFGDCDDIAALSGAAFRAVGYHVKVKVIKTRGNESFHHVYIVVGLPPENPYSWIPVDPAYYSSPGEEAPGIQEQKLYEVD